MKKNISITSVSSISALGSSSEIVWKNYLNDNHYLKNKNFIKFEAPVGSISEDDNKKIKILRKSDQNYKPLDRSVLLAIYSSREAIKKVNWIKNFGVNIGSSRGATELFEKYYDSFRKNEYGKAEVISSPTTTLGNISSWTSYDLQTKGPTISHSITCSTSLHSLINGVAWIRAGMTDNFLVGGSEAANTPFTIAQMKALKIYASNHQKGEFPCKALDLEKKKNSMVLGEGAASLCLERGVKKNTLAIVKGIGYAVEKIKHNTSISSNAICFQKSMKMAMKDANLTKVDAIVMHAPGTIKGDLSEYNAIKTIFKEKLPAMTSNKWKIGHTLGASGVLSIELAILMLQNQKFISAPYLKNKEEINALKTVLVNSVGFGGNAVSILLSIP